MHRIVPHLLLILTLGAFAAGAQSTVTCRGPAGGHLGSAAVCEQLTRHLAGRPTVVTLELTRDEPQVLAGRLIWQMEGRQVTGPLVDVTSQDRTLDARAPERLVRGLLAVSDLP